MTGRQPFCSTVQLRSLSMVRVMGRAERAQAVSMVTLKASSLSLPCTKGVAKASAAHAANSRSPVLKVIRCGVLSTVTG